MADASDANVNWHFSGTEETQLATLACVAWVEQQQREPLVTSMDWDEESEEGSDAATNVVDVLAESSHRGLKKRFLDRLAEVFARKKVPINLVSCTAMAEKEDSVTIFVSRNAEFSEVDSAFCSKFTACLEKLCQGRTKNDEANQLWQLLLKFYGSRIGYHIRQFLKHVQSISHRRSALAVEEDGSLKGFHKLRSDCEHYLAGDTLLGGCIVENAYFLARAVDFEACLVKNAISGNVQSTLGLLGFLGRLRAAYLTFMDTAGRFPSFCQVRIVRVPAPQASKTPRADVDQALNLVGACLDARGVVSPSWVAERAPANKIAKLEAHLRQSLHVHAEIQMLFFLLHPARKSIQPLPYLGVSKKTCLLCGHMLAGFSTFETRGNHGKIFPRWTLPRQARLQEAYLMKMDEAARSLMETAAALLADQDRSKRDFVQESVAAPSTNSGLGSTVDSSMHHLRRQHLGRQTRERETRWLENIGKEILDAKSPTMIPEGSELEKIRQGALPTAPRSKVCDGCGELGQLKRCSKCDEGWYCGRECQKAAWYRHKFHCRIGRPLDSADYLVLACLKYQLPDEPSVLNDFGFDHFLDFHSQSHIFGLFICLVTYLKVSDRRLHRWQVDGTLKENIIKLFSIIPEHRRGGYFRWFLKHDWIFSPPGEKSSSAHIEALTQSSISILDTEDRTIHATHLRPEAKQHAFLFYALLSKGWYPRPGMPAWTKLGFCTRQNEWEERLLVDMYQQLIDKCSLRDFWEAMDTSNMLGLLDQYDLTKTYQGFRHFETLMRNVHASSSVWYLKEFCNIDEPNPIRPVVADYGFINCNDFKDRQDLKEAYQKFFNNQGDEMELHVACCKGRIFEYIHSKQHLEPQIPTFDAESVSASRYLVVNSAHIRLSRTRASREPDRLSASRADGEPA